MRKRDRYAALAASGLLFAMPAVAADCPAIARVISAQGTVEWRRPPSVQWAPAPVETPLCGGDTLRVGEHSRAALRLVNDSNLRLDQNTTLTLDAVPERVSVIGLVRGVINVITRTRKPFEVRTPFLNAGVEGTEFLVAAGPDAAQVAVFEGSVSAANRQGTVALGPGDIAVASRDSPPRRERMVHPTEAVQWALHYPSIIAPGDAEEAPLREADALASSGRIAEAFARLDAVPPAARSARHAAYRGELLLVLGRVDEARAEIARSLTLDARSSDAHALLAIVAVVQNEGGEALRLAQQAVQMDPRAPAARIALSYAEQARFDMAAALASAEQAAALAPDNALAWARVAELRMASGDLHAALEAAERAAALRPQLARAQTVLGFAHLTRIETAAARQAFNRAIALDSTDPLQRLGLGLARIRDGELAAGREDLEIAVGLDPLNSLVRSYAGKAYFEEMRDALAGGQFTIARQLDPRDPTPYFYDAIRKQAGNRPVDALLDLNRSVALNDSRAVYRSRLLLDDDNAARTASIASIHRELGFEKLSVLESVRALSDNAANDAAHRQLAAAYVSVPRHDITRVSESLQAQLRQPLTATPVDPQLGTDNLVMLADTGPTRLGAGEYNALFSRDQLRFEADGVVGSRGTRGDQLMLSGLGGRLAWSASQFHYETDGFEDNNRLSKNAYDLFVQGALSPTMSLQADLRRTDFELGKTYYAFDPALATPVKIKEDDKAWRLGGRTGDTSADWIWSIFHEDRTRTTAAAGDGTVFTTADTRIHAAELQYTRKWPGLQIVAGGGHVKATDTFPIEEADARAKATSAYVYSQWSAGHWPATVLLGLSYDRFDYKHSAYDQPVVVHRFNPKLGLVWTATADTTLRAALMSSVKRPFVESQTLEPTQVAGFNQFFTGFDTLFGDTDGTLSKRAALAVDHRVSERTFAGAEVSGRKLDVPNLSVGNTEWRERGAHAYLYHAVQAWPGQGWQTAMSADFDLERFMRPQLNTGAEAIVDVRTKRLSLKLKAFHVSGLALGTTVSYIDQSGIFAVDINSPTFDQSDRGWVADLSLDYRLPRRWGVLSFGVRNLFDAPLSIFETDPVHPQVAKRRLVFGRVRLSF